jgi:hypothetical protein
MSQKGLHLDAIGFGLHELAIQFHHLFCNCVLVFPVSSSSVRALELMRARDCCWPVLGAFNDCALGLVKSE